MPGEASGKERHMKKEIYKAKNDLPYEKFMRLGSHILTEAELLAITIRTGTKDRKAVEIGQEILSLPSVKEHGLGGLYYVTIQELMEIKGIGQVKAVKLKCLAELSMRIAMATAKEGLRFLDPSSVAKYYMESLRREKKEKVLLLLLDQKERLLGEEVLSIGTVSMSLLSPREIFVTALKKEAVHIMLLHNHPSGDPTPSKQDMRVTEEIQEIGKMIDIPLIDHIILGDNRYMSFQEAGLL